MSKQLERFAEVFVFASRWIQAPIYLGLIIGAGLYCYKFLIQLVHMFAAINELTEEQVMLGLLGLVDMSMVANLVYMVVVGGYSLFVSKIDLVGHPDRPEWLDSTNANTLKIKLASSLVGVSGIHLLKTFIELTGHDVFEPAIFQHVKWQVLIHLTFLGTSISLAFAEWLLHPPSRDGHTH
jgi:uncharacterized protein (TIGR00645 family)